MTEKFDSDFGLLSNSSNDIFPNDNMFDGETDGNDVQPDDVIIIYMDITEPLSKLKTLLEQKVGMALKKYRFWLQDAQMLEPHKNLVDQCVEGEGIVQINVQLQAINRRINIVDVLKPTEESLEFLANELSLPDTKPFNDLKMDDNRNNTDSSDDGDEDDDDGSKGGGHARDRDDDDNSNDIIKNIFNDDELTPKWILDNNCKFKKDQARLNIPDDPSEWSTSQVQHWLQWAVREFHMTQIKFSDWLITGKQLCEMPLTEFDKIVPYDPGNIFRTHFELLRKCKFVAVLQNRKTLDLKIFGAENNTKPVRVMKKMPKKVTASINDDKHYMLSDTLHRNPVGQIQLWQFLLDLLTDHEYRSIIHWITPDGEFRLADPEQVAKLWGLRKNKPSMNYEKLSRALRYYYDGDMISKVHGKRFVYKFVCNLKQLIGYDARELARLIAHCAMMKKKEKADKNAHNI